MATMAEYTEKEALIAHIKNLPTYWADAGGVYGRSMKYPEGMFDCEDVISSVENAPAADVEPVVRCRDCKHRYVTIDARCCSYGTFYAVAVSDDFFCALAERKDGDDNAVD